MFQTTGEIVIIALYCSNLQGVVVPVPVGGMPSYSVFYPLGTGS